MIIDLNNKFVILHAPRTGGTTLKQSINKKLINKSVFTFDNSDNCHPDLKKFRSRFCAHYNITELKYLSSNFYNFIKDFNFYQIIRSPYERFWSCLRLYFDTNRIDYTRLSHKELMKIINDLLNKTTSITRNIKILI